MLCIFIIIENLEKIHLKLIYFYYAFSSIMPSQIIGKCIFKMLEMTNWEIEKILQVRDFEIENFKNSIILWKFFTLLNEIRSNWSIKCFTQSNLNNLSNLSLRWLIYLLHNVFLITVLVVKIRLNNLLSPNLCHINIDRIHFYWFTL